MSSVAKFTRSLDRLQETQFKDREPVDVPNAVRSRHSLPVPIIDITVEGRLRSIDDDAVDHLAESMARQGQLYPINIRTLDEGGYQLVAGAHRIAAAEKLGWTIIEAFVVDNQPDDEIVLHEIDENLCRAKLTRLDRGVFLAKRKEIYQRIFPDLRRGGDHKSLDYQENIKRQTLAFDPDASPPASFADHTAAMTPFAPSTINRAVSIGENILPDLQEALSRTPLANREGDLRRIASMDTDKQRDLLNSLQQADKPPKSLSALQKDPTTAPPKPGDVEGLKRIWLKSSEAERAEFRSWQDREGDE